VSHPLRVAHVTTIDMSLRYLLLNQLRHLAQAGYEVVGVSSPGPDVNVLRQQGIDHIPVPMTRNPFTPLHDLRALLRLTGVFRRERFTIVHTHNPKPGLLGQVAARLAGVPIVVNTLHGFYFSDNMRPGLRRVYIAMERIAARCSDAILSQNREDMATAVREGICEPDKISYLGNGIDLTRFDPAAVSDEQMARKRQEIGLPATGPVVGFVGRLVEEKGLLELFAAARVVQAQVPAVRFVFVGPVDEHKPDAITPAKALDCGIGGFSSFLGMRQDMPELYRLMDVFVLPSHREGFPRSPMEASAMCVPCVATDIRGCREAVEHGRNGLLVPLRDSEALADAIVKLLTDEEKARTMGAQGRQTALERFDERKVFRKVLDTYAGLLAQKGLPVPDPVS
jgi:glycosyltransferase involved in cell wall biosynthesis